MIAWIKKLFTNKEENIDNIEKINNFITLNDIYLHFSDPTNGFQENKELIKEIEESLQENKKNIFILDDIEEIVDILYNELIESLKKYNKLDKFNIVKMHSSLVGFDMLSILSNHENIIVHCLITDITFGGNAILNKQKIILDGIDILILSKMKFNDLKFLIFTGNILSENNIKNYNFAKKFEYYFKENILNYTIIKDSAINFMGNDNGIFDKLVETL